MSDKTAESYRNELEALLRRADDDGFKLQVDIEVDYYQDDSIDIDLVFYVQDVKDEQPSAFVNSDLIWSREV